MVKEEVQEKVVLLEPVQDDYNQAELPVLKIVGPGDPRWKNLLQVFSNPVSQAMLLAGPEFLNFPEPFTGKIPVAINWDQPLARRGFILKKGEEMKVHSETYFVTLDTSPAVVQEGGVEEIFPHELSHVFLLMLLGEENVYSRFRSTRMHLTTSTTDEALAFFEGWGNHLQPLSRDFTRNDAFLFRTCFAPGPQEFWCCKREDRLRLQGVPANIFIHPPREIDPPPRDLDTWYRDHLTSVNLAEDRLKNANQLLASEGVMASFFYILARNLIAPPRSLSLADYFRLSLGVIKGMKSYLDQDPIFSPDFFFPTRPPLLLIFLKTWKELFPAGYQEVWQVFLENTRLQTFSRELLEMLEPIYRAGRYGKIEKLQELIPSWRGKNQKLLEDALASPNPLPLYGPELWVRNQEFQVAFGLWMEEPLSPLTFDLNAAELFDLMTIPGMETGPARAILKSREKNGLFHSLQDLYERVDLSPDLRATIKSMAGAMVQDSSVKYF